MDRGLVPLYVKSLAANIWNEITLYINSLDASCASWFLNWRGRRAISG
jgi:hypothetical protein